MEAENSQGVHLALSKLETGRALRHEKATVPSSKSQADPKFSL